MCRQAFEVGQRKGQLVRSDEIFMELAATLEKPRLQKYIKGEDKVDFLSNFLQLTKSVAPTARITVCRDPKDNMFLELAVSSGRCGNCYQRWGLAITPPF